MTRRPHQTQTQPNAMYCLNKSTAMPSHEQNLELFQLLETAQCRISEIKANPNAHPGELKQWERTEERLVNDLITANEGLVRSISGRYAGRLGKHEELDRVLFSDGCFGLSKAIQKFDWRRGYAFSTYAYPWIKQAISRSPAFKGSLHIPEGRFKEIREVKELIAKLSREYGRKPLAEDIAKEMGIPVKKAHELNELASLSLVMLDAEIGGTDGITYGNLIPDSSAEDPREAAERADRLDLVGEAAETLVGLEREVFLMFMDDPGRSLEATGKALGRTGERIRQIRIAAFEKVRAYVEAKDHKSPAQALKVFVAKNESAPAGEKGAAAPVAKSRGFYLKMRAVEKNPNHHIWNNNGTWYCDFTLVTDSGERNRVRNPLYTDNVEDARRRRDNFILLYNGSSDTAA